MAEPLRTFEVTTAFRSQVKGLKKHDEKVLAQVKQHPLPQTLDTNHFKAKPIHVKDDNIRYAALALYLEDLHKLFLDSKDLHHAFLKAESFSDDNLMDHPRNMIRLLHEFVVDNNVSLKDARLTLHQRKPEAGKDIDDTIVHVAYDFFTKTDNVDDLVKRYPEQTISLTPAEADQVEKDLPRALYVMRRYLNMTRPQGELEKLVAIAMDRYPDMAQSVDILYNGRSLMETHDS